MAKAKLSDLVNEKEIKQQAVAETLKEEEAEVKEKRTTVQVIYLTPSEKAFIKSEAKKMRLKLSDYIRVKIMQVV